MQLRSVNSIAVVQFDEAADLPRLTRATMESLTALLTTLVCESSFHGIVILSNRESFAIGADLGEVTEIKGHVARDFSRLGQKLCCQIAQASQPVIAGIRGYCLGGGLDLALACHARVATFDASFGHPGGSLGLVTGWGGTQRLPRLIGKSPALQMLLTGERIPATQALTMGLVDELVASQDLEIAAVQFCRRLATTPGEP
jgi:enoyl-CoA hydratase/carnithine racemase